MADDEKDIEKLVGDLEAHSLKDEVPGGEEFVPDTDNCTGTCTCPCEE